MELIKGAYERYLIAGICKQRTLDGKAPILIDHQFITENYKNENPPIEFEEKCFALLKNLYHMGGKINKDLELNSTRDFALGYADAEEFCRIVEQLEDDYSITIRKTHRMARGNGSKVYIGVKMTSSGKEKAAKVLSKMPMVGLVSQEITTGDLETDQKINHARGFFFAKPQNMDKMRSACETLSYVLEPLRDDLTDVFSSKDVADFFQLVNRFDIRHNKDTFCGGRAGGNGRFYGFQ
ncbi:hypothetical protein GM921_00650 [Pedobacter sp. LMG 31464]|uniref:Uncharacterized protein n=1 Tax=Pedobacter planticolens TaxID=2679964 RepID=A0A923DXU0_9SPHI|nr:hypothetical protein [Pedobacter planticolens]MBB2143979.1 hypothetical protein [Pedobacter planticolens]